LTTFYVYSLKGHLLTAAVKQYIANCQTYTIYQIIPRLRKLLGVEMFHKVPIPTSANAKQRAKSRAKVVSAVIYCLQGRGQLDETSLREHFEKFLDPHYTTFILGAIVSAMQDVRQNVLQGRALFIDEKDPQTRRYHQSFVNAKRLFHEWIPIHYAILRRYEALSPNTKRPLYPRHPVDLTPFTILPKYDFTPKNIIINTDQALYDLWSLAGWDGVEKPTSPEAFKVESSTWWSRTFKTEKVDTTSGGQRRFCGAVYTDGVSYKASVKKRFLVPVGGGSDQKGEGDGEDEEEEEDDVCDVGDLLDSSDDEDDDFLEMKTTTTPAKKRKRSSDDGDEGATSRKKRKTKPSSNPPPDPPGLDRFFRPVLLQENTPVWGIDPGRRDPIYAVNNCGKSYRVRLRHYYKLCGFTEARKKRERWLRRAKTVSEAMDDLSKETYKTSSLSTFDDYLLILLPNLTLILGHYFRPRHRRSRSNSYIRTQKAWDILLSPFQGCVVALGAAMFSHNSRGHAAGPVKQLRKQLKRRASQLRLIGEYNTSKVCHLCEGFFGGKQRWWSLRVCRDVCGGRVMSRDYNAAMNILAIFLFMNTHGGQRPEPFFYKWDTLPPQMGVH